MLGNLFLIGQQFWLERLIFLLGCTAPAGGGDRSNGDLPPLSRTKILGDQPITSNLSRSREYMKGEGFKFLSARQRSRDGAYSGNNNLREGTTCITSPSRTFSRVLSTQASYSDCVVP